MRNRDSFEQHHANMQREFDSSFKWFKRFFVLWIFVILGMMGFGFWVVVKLLQHFGVI